MSYKSVILADSPRGYWRMGEIGPTMNDYSGHGLSGTINGGDNLVAGALIGDPDGAHGFDGATQYITVADNDLLDPGDVFTLECWASFHSYNNSPCLFDKGIGGYSLNAAKQTSGSNGQVRLGKTGTGEIVKSTIALTPDTFQYIVVTKNGSDIHIYIDGIDRTGSISNQTIAATATDLYLGRGVNPATYGYVNAIIDEMAIYAVALSPARIQVHYLAGRGMFQPPAYATHLDYNADLAHSGVATASSANAAYPVANVGNLPISKPWRTTACASEYVELDLQSAQPFNFIALLNHNLTAAAIVTIAAGAAPNPSTYTTAIVYREFDCFVLLAALQTYRYVRITISDSGNPDGVISVGAVLIGNAPTLDFGFDYSWQASDIDNNLVVQSEYNVIHAQALNSQIALKHSYNQLTADMMATLRAIHRAAKTNRYPLFWIPLSDDYNGYFVRFDASFTKIVGLRSSAQVGFIEDSRGQAIGA